MKLFLFIAYAFFVGAFFSQPLWAASPDCSKIVHVAGDSKEGKEILKNIERIIKERLKEKVRVKYRTIEKSGMWLIAEFDPDKLEPGIFVLKKEKSGYKWAAEFGGGSQDDQEETIRHYFIKKLPAAPQELFQCFTPKGAPFRNEYQQ